MHERTAFMVRPLCLADGAVIDDRTLWSKPRICMSPLCYGIGAFTQVGELGAYGGFLYDKRGEEATITAIQSRMPGAGMALLDALKVRTYRLVAEDVLAPAAAWWKKRGFVLLAPASEDDEEGVVGTFEWWRDDDPVFVDLPYASMWPNHRSMARLVWDEQDRQEALAVAAAVAQRMDSLLRRG
jgi:hypothetical protein